MAKFTIGDRVKTTVDAPSAWAGGWGAPKGTGGTVDYVSPHTPGYGVQLDGDPSQLSAAYNGDELEAEL